MMESYGIIANDSSKVRKMVANPQIGGDAYVCIYGFTPRRELNMSVYEALTLMIAFATLVVLVLGFNDKQKK